MKKKLYSFLRFLSNSRVFALALLWLMAILIAGTVAEKTTGLYVAEQRYFSSAVIWLWGFIPLPGLLSVTAFIFFGLLARLALEDWRWAHLGTIVIHIGAALLLFGGFVTAMISRDGIMVIPQNETRNYMEDMHHRELAISELRGKDVIDQAVIPESNLAKGSALSTNLPFHIEPIAWCANCALRRLPSPLTEGNPHGVAINFVLLPIPAAPDDAHNRGGFTFRLSGTPDRDGLYAIFEDMPIPEIVTVGEKKYLISIRRARAPLPFTITLKQFDEELYPGTSKPRSYQSDVILSDHGILWPSRIRMNEPLRYKGYTFYQSSFIEASGGTTTVLAVVKNAGRLFPYLSGTIIVVGFIIHLFQRLIRRKRLWA